MQQTHWSKNFCGMYGFSAKSSVPTLNILRLLIRCLESLWNFVSSEVSNIPNSNAMLLMQEWIKTHLYWRKKPKIFTKILKKKRHKEISRNFSEFVEKTVIIRKIAFSFIIWIIFLNYIVLVNKSRITNIQFFWLKSVPKYFFLAVTKRITS